MQVVVAHKLFLSLNTLMVAQVLISLITQQRPQSAARFVARAFSTHVASTTSWKHKSPTPFLTLSPSAGVSRSFHSTVVARKATVEEDLDTALESILGDAFQESGSSKPIKKKGSKKEWVESSVRMLSVGRTAGQTRSKE